MVSLHDPANTRSNSPEISARAWAAVLVAWLLLSPASAGQAHDPGLREDLQALLAGAWQSTDDDPAGATMLEFRGRICVSAWHSHQSLYQIDYAADAITRTPLDDGQPLQDQVCLHGKLLTLTSADMASHSFRRLKRSPRRTHIEPFSPGLGAPNGPALTAIIADLAQRMEREQDVRKRLNSLMSQARSESRMEGEHAYQEVMQGGRAGAILQEMAAIDTDNTRALIELILDVGWIDGERFGHTASKAAFLIVQHSGHLGLMRTALRSLEKELRQRPDLGADYARLYDRTQLALGGSQRYGSQLSTGPDGSLYLNRLEHPEELDARRAAMGMVPLEEYLDIFRADGTPVIVGELPVAVSAPGP